MEISIFPKVKPLPTKEEKAIQAKYASSPHSPVSVEIQTEDDLIDIITTNAWSPAVFSGVRSQKTFVKTDFLVYDIDEGQTIEEAEEIAYKLGYTCLCMPSTSHTPENHRFRLIFPLLTSITDKGVYESTMRKIGENFSYDPKCLTDQARFYFGCKSDDGFFIEADLVPPEKPRMPPKMDYNSQPKAMVGENIEALVERLYGSQRDMIPESIAYFLEHAHTGLSGEMYMRGNSFLFTAALSGCEYQNIIDVFYHLYPHEVDSKVENMVDNIIRDGIKAKEETDNVDISKKVEYPRRRRRRS